MHLESGGVLEYLSNFYFIYRVHGIRHIELRAGEANQCAASELQRAPGRRQRRRNCCVLGGVEPIRPPPPAVMPHCPLEACPPPLLLSAEEGGRVGPGRPLEVPPSGAASAAVSCARKLARKPVTAPSRDAPASRFCQLARAGRFAAVTDGGDVLSHGIAAVAGAQRGRRRVE